MSAAEATQDPVLREMDRLDGIIARQIEEQAREIAEMRAQLENLPETISHVDAVELVASMLLRREGETLTQAVAYERSRNVIQALAGLMVAK